MTTIIRQVTDQDIPQLADLYLAGRQNFSWETSPELMDYFLDTEDEDVFLIEEDSQILGFISLYDPDNFIHLLFIDEAAKGRGLARQLINYVKELVTGPLTLKCVTENRQAYQFYVKNGWTVLEENLTSEPNYYLMELT